MSSFDESWLTAYIDDELSEDERRFVESKLASDPLLKKVLEDLYQVRSMVVGLRPGVLESDLTQSVLGKIQDAAPTKEPLAIPATTTFEEQRENVGSVQTRSVSQSPSPSPRTTGNWRWFGVAMAASIVGGLLYFKPWLDIPSLPVAMENLGERALGKPASADQEMVMDQPMDLSSGAPSNLSPMAPSKGAMAPKASRDSVTTDALVMGPATSVSPELGPSRDSKSIANSLAPDASFGTGGQGEGRLRSAQRVEPGLPLSEPLSDSNMTDKATGDLAKNPRRSAGTMEKSEEGQGPGGGGFGGGRGLGG